MRKRTTTTKTVSIRKSNPPDGRQGIIQALPTHLVIAQILAVFFVPSGTADVTPQPRRGTRDTKGKRMEMSLMKPAKLTLVRPLSALVVRFVPFCGYA
jgi:hypothetical protein